MVTKRLVFGIEQQDVYAFSLEQREAVFLQACVSISQEPPVVYKNQRPARYESFYGYCQLMSGEFVVQTIKLDFLNQEVAVWSDGTFYLMDTVICIGKELAILSGGTLSGHVLVRNLSRITSLRFRLVPGTLANLILKWEVGNSSCDTPVLSRSEDELTPPEPENHQYIPGSQPAASEKDNFAPTLNDGMPYDNEDERPPYAEILPISGEWWEIVTYSNAAPSTAALGDTDPTSIWSAGGVCSGGQQGATHPNGRNGISALKNGSFQYCAQNDTKGSVTSLNFEFRLDN